MAKSKKIAANEVSENTKSNTNNEVVVAQSATANEVSETTKTDKPKTQRVLETRGDWEQIFNQCVALVATLVKGKALDENCREGFHFVKVADAPHSRGYAKALLTAFSSQKADKFLANAKNPSLAMQEKRQKIALQVLLASKLAKDESKALEVLTKGEKKQCKTFCEAVLNAIA